MQGTQTIASPSGGIRLLSESNIEKLFDEFTYKIPLNLTNHVTAIIAPNGTGKTLCLRMIAGLFQQRWSVFADNDFSRISYEFTDGTKVEITKVFPDVTTDPEPNRPSFNLTVTDPHSNVVEEWTPRLSIDPRRVSQMERYIPFLRRAGPAVWRDDRTGEAYNLAEVMEEFGDSLPEAVKTNFYGKKPEALSAITSQIDCHLIETQRLLIFRGWARAILPRSTTTLYARDFEKGRSTKGNHFAAN